MDPTQKNLLVLASAGSGKTYRLSDRIIDLLAAGAAPEEIVALTFTRKAAGEFADAILKKLADAVDDPKKAQILRASIGDPNADFLLILEKVIQKLPRLTLGTMDMFFGKIVRSFQYELGLAGGTYELIQGELAEVLKEQILIQILEQGVPGLADGNLKQMIRSSTEGAAAVRVLRPLHEYIERWHGAFLERGNIEWGPEYLSRRPKEDWELKKGSLIATIRATWPDAEPKAKEQASAAVKAALDGLEAYTIGSGKLENVNSLMAAMLEQAASPEEELVLKSYRVEFHLPKECAAALREVLRLAAECELDLALSRSRGIGQLIAAYDQRLDTELRKKGRLEFGDVKRLLGAWQNGEEARLRREKIDFRLDGTYRHWLLDEFQDTSLDDWHGLLPLLEEAIVDEEKTTFIVGDRKQAIYSWRGGEVGLFDEVKNQYGGGFATAHMSQSYRSCPQVLEMVNQVFGDQSGMEDLFPEVAEDWQWEDHHAADKCAEDAYAGCAQLSLVDADQKQSAVFQTLKQLGVGTKKLACAVLVNSNKETKDWADLLRAEGYDVIEGGARKPGEDHPNGVAMVQLLRWLADPSDRFAWGVVKMSPLGKWLRDEYGSHDLIVWDRLTELVSAGGFGAMLAHVVTPMLPSWTEYGRRRAADLLQIVSDLDRNGVMQARDVAEIASRAKITQSPGLAAIQVMTIHKSKGLGFDAVLLPEISNVKIPSRVHLNILGTGEWLMQPSTGWVRSFIPEMKEAEDAWARGQAYDAFCKLYVGLTRAKRGLYLFVESIKKGPDPQHPSLANWLMQALQLDWNAEPGESIVIGDPQWAAALETREAPKLTNLPSLTNALAMRARTTPSGEKKKASEAQVNLSYDGRKFGTAVHAAFEQIGWLDEKDAVLEFSSETKDLMIATLKLDSVKELLTKNGRRIDLFREQQLEAIYQGKWMSGVIDRLHVILNEEGEVQKVEIIDFKTDRVPESGELKSRYASQMNAYRGALEEIYPQSEIACLLLSTNLGEVIEI